MVGAIDLKVYKSASIGLGGPIDLTQQVQNSSPLNIFGNIPKNEIVTGIDYYHCVYWKNGHATEPMEAFKLWLTQKSFPHDTVLKWGFDASVGGSGYRWSPYSSFNGTSTKIEVADDSSFDLNTFTLALWFNTSVNPLTGQVFILAGKGKFSSDTAGDNENYVLYMNNDGSISGGFEESTGANHIVTSGPGYDNGVWHNAMVYFDGANVKLDIDGSNVGNLATATTPQTNAHKFTIGASSSESASFYEGLIDEVRLFNYALTSGERTALYTSNTLPASGLVYEKNFGINDNIYVAQTIADKHTAPTGITWHDVEAEPATPNRGELKAGIAFPTWLWLHVNANAKERLDDSAIFSFRFGIPQGGTGSTGGSGSGGDDAHPEILNLDKFGLNQFFPTKVGGREWFSTAWANGNTRDVGPEDFDPDDPNLGSKNATPLTINGDGTAKYSAFGASHRVFVVGPWTNTETTVLIKVNTSCESFQIRGRSNHHGVQNLPYGLYAPEPPTISCGFGNYLCKWSEAGDDKVSSEVEVIHDCYQRDLDVHDSVQPPNGQYTGYKQILRSIGTTAVSVQGYINRDINNQASWHLETEFIYDGTNVNPDATEPNVTDCLASGDSVSGDLVANSKWLNPSKWTWLRFNNADDVVIKSFSVREINPITSSGGSSGGGGNPPPTNTNFKIGFCGDEGCGSVTNSVVNLLKNYDFVVSVGDHAYASASCWTSAFLPLKSKMNSVYGNHEYSESGGVTPYKTFFNHSKTYNTFQFQNVFFLLIDGNINMDPGSTQHNFFVSELGRIANDNTITWKIGVLHFPMFGASSTHSYNSGNSVQAFMQLFIDNHVSFVVAGHNHNFQRTKQVKYNSGSPTSPTVVNSISPFDRSASGLIHVVSGTGGHDSGSSLYPLGTQPSFQAYQNRSHNGIWEIVASNNAQTLTCSFVDTGGNKYDTFIINA